MRFPSPFHSATAGGRESTEMHERRFSVSLQNGLFESTETPAPGSLNDGLTIRTALVEAIRKCGKSRAQLADEMSLLTGTEVTVRRINAFTANSREDYHFPAELIRAFCVATGDYSLLFCLPELAGFRVITEEQAELMELGRQFLAKKAADERIAILESRLQRRGL